MHSFLAEKFKEARQLRLVLQTIGDEPVFLLHAISLPYILNGLAAEWKVKSYLAFQLSNFTIDAIAKLDIQLK